jgi:hypothetical protein
MPMTEYIGRRPECLSRLQCDQLLNGELEDRPDLKEHQLGCARCTALLATHRGERAEFASVVRPPRRHRRWVAGMAAVAATLGLWIVASRDRREDPETRSKGGPTIAFYLKHGDAVRKGAVGEIVFPHDAINFTASTDRPAFLAVISIDGAQKVSVYYPDDPTAAPIGMGREQVLPLSVVLDDVVGRERLVGVFCDRPLAVAALAAAIAEGAALPSGCLQDVLTIEKRQAP